MLGNIFYFWMIHLKNKNVNQHMINIGMIERHFDLDFLYGTTYRITHQIIDDCSSLRPLLYWSKEWVRCFLSINAQTEAFKMWSTRPRP